MFLWQLTLAIYGRSEHYQNISITQFMCHLANVCDIIREANLQTCYIQEHDFSIFSKDGHFNVII